MHLEFMLEGCIHLHAHSSLTSIRTGMVYTYNVPAYTSLCLSGRQCCLCTRPRHPGPIRRGCCVHHTTLCLSGGDAVCVHAHTTFSLPGGDAVCVHAHTTLGLPEGNAVYMRTYTSLGLHISKRMLRPHPHHHRSLRSGMLCTVHATPTPASVYQERDAVYMPHPHQHRSIRSGMLCTCHTHTSLELS